MSKKILILRHAYGPDFLVENISKSDCSLERICSGKKESEREREKEGEKESLNFRVCDQHKTSSSPHMLTRGNTNI